MQGLMLWINFGVEIEGLADVRLRTTRKEDEV